MPGRGRSRTAKSPESKLTNGTSTPKREATSRGSQKPEAPEKQTCSSEEQAAKKKEEKAKEQFPGNNGDVKERSRDATRKTSTMVSGSRGASSEMTEDEVIKIKAQVEPNAKDTARSTRPKIYAASAKSLEEEEVGVNDTVKIRNGRKVKEISRACERAKYKTEEVALVRGMKQLSHKDKNKDDATKKAEPSTILYTTLDKLKIRMNEKCKASEVINKLEEVILGHLRSNTLCFKQVKPPLHTGSYYENLKISNPDEFDIMFPIPVESVDIKPFSDDGAFYSVSLKSRYHPLKRFQSESKPLPASEILQEFRNEVIKSIQKFPGVEINRKKKGCPAVTLNVTVDSCLISLDIVLCLAVQSSWPNFTKDGLKIEGWLGRKVKQKYKYVPYYLVPKYEGTGTIESNGVLAKDAWRISFSHVEKDIFNNHGSEKTCCEKDGARCCRKDCLKLLKHLLSLLKDQDKSFDKFCSYYAKTTLLHACCSRTKDTQWAAADLSQCFEQLLKEFENHLERHELNNFFIPTQNLLSGCSEKNCTSLAQQIKKQREEGFPVFH